MKMSFQPSLSMSRNFVLQPLCPTDAVPTPEGKVRSRKKPLPWFTKSVKES